MGKRPIPSKTRMHEIFEAAKNWGRWGPDDQAGALNLIDDEVRRGAAAAVRHGRAVSCALDMPVVPAPDNPHPALHMMIRGGDDCVMHGFDLEYTADFIGIAFHGMATSHLDALCHVLKDGRMYNGFPGSDVKSTGAKRNNVMCAKDGIVSRGVLLDMPRLLGVPWLELGHVIDPEDLEAAEARQNVKVRRGDIVLVSTGRDARRVRHRDWSPMDGQPGLHPECLPWLHERDVAVLGSDYGSDVLPLPVPIEGWFMPIHQTALVAMGVHLLDNLHLAALMAACAELQQWDFQLTIAPLRIPEGTGSPVNPIALL